MFYTLATENGSGQRIEANAKNIATPANLTINYDADTATAASSFYDAAAKASLAFNAMMPKISEWLAKNPTATTEKLAAQIAKINAASTAAAKYVETIVSSEPLKKGTVVLNWAVSTDANYPSTTQPAVKAYLLKDEAVTMPLKITAANLVRSGHADPITADTNVAHVEVASFDAKGNFVYGPEDVTKGLKIDKNFIAKNPDLLVRAMFTSKGSQTSVQLSVGILKEAINNDTEAGTLPAGTLKAEPVATYVGANKALFEELAAGYPYFVEFPLQLVASFDTAASGGEGTETAETYKLKASDVTFTGSDGQTKTYAADTKYATSQDSAPVWGTVEFKVSADKLAAFEVTISTDNSAIALIGLDSQKIDDFDGKKIDVAGIEGAYDVIFSADLVASSDGTVSGDGYFAITVEVASISVAPVVPGGEGSGSVTPEPDSGSVTPEPEPSGTTPVAPEDAKSTADANGNEVADAGQKIDNKFTDASSSAAANLINSATAAERASIEDVAGALGISEADVGNAADGFKAIGLKVPDNVTLPAEGTPFFVVVQRNSSRHVGFGYIPKRRAGYEKILAIMFKLFKDPTDTSKYMVVDAGDNTVAATDSDGSDNGSAAAVNKVVFVTADGEAAFKLKTTNTVPLQGQNANGVATEIEQESGSGGSTSRHGGGSSSCDAGFGLIALAAIALAARKVRK